MENTNIDGMMRKIAALLASAESFQNSNPPNLEAAATYREKAESLMRDYRIQEEQLIREQVSSGEPIWKTIPVSTYPSEWLSVMQSMFWNVARHCGIESTDDIVRVDGKAVSMASAVGYEMDLRLAEMIFTAAKLAFLAKLDPEYDPRESAEENIYRLRSAGIDRQKIAKLVFGKEGHPEGIKVGKIYRAECERRGETDAVSGRGFNRAAYREAYADEFARTITRRLRAARNAADSVGGALVLPERAARVKEAFYAKNPWARPETKEERAEREARQAAYEASLTPQERAERERDQKRIARRSKWTQADEAKWQRVHGAQSEAAREAGASAARGVDLTREAPRARRAEQRSNGGEIEG